MSGIGPWRLGQIALTAIPHTPSTKRGTHLLKEGRLEQFVGFIEHNEPQPAHGEEDRRQWSGLLAWLAPDWGHNSAGNFAGHSLPSPLPP